MVGRPFGRLSRFRLLLGKGVVNPPIEKWLFPELMLSILRKTQEMTMQLTAYRNKLFAVDLFSDGGSMNQSPWLRLGELQSLDQAIATCKKVVDEYLSQRKYLAACVLPSKRPLITCRTMALTRPIRPLGSISVSGCCLTVSRP